MKTYHSVEAKVPRHIKDKALTEPVALTENGRITHVIMSVNEYLKLRGRNENKPQRNRGNI